MPTSSKDPTPTAPQAPSDSSAPGIVAPTTRVVRAVERGLGDAAWWGFRHPGRVLAACGLLTLAALGLSWGLHLESDLTSLLPESFRSVQGLKELERRFGGVGYVCVVADSPDPAQLERFAEEVAPKLEALPSINYVEFRRPMEFLRQRGLYFLPLQDLQRLDQQLAARVKWERDRRNPLYVDLEDKPAPTVDTDSLGGSSATSAAGTWVEAQGAEPYYLDREAGRIVLLAKPQEVPRDLATARAVVADVERLLASLPAGAYGPGFTTALTGRYPKRVVLQRALQADLGFAAGLAMLLTLAYLALHFRRLGAVVLIVTPLALGLSWTMGVAGAVFGQLNILTGFIGAILLGLGVDHGIHLLGRYESEQRGEGSTQDRVRRAFGGTGRAVIVAALTTIAAFVGVGLSQFRAFREFGILAAAGMALVVVAYSLVLPALLGLADRIGWRPATARQEATSPFARRVTGWAPALVVLLGVGLAAAVLNIPQLSFDYDLGSLESNDLPVFQLDLDVNRILGYSQTPAVVLTNGEDQERVVSSELRRRKEELGATSTVDFVATVADLVPEGQQEKQAVLESIHRTVRKVKERWLDEDLRKPFRMLREMSAAEPFTRDDLPLEVRRQFTGDRGDQVAGFVLVFPNISLTDGAAVRRFAEELRALRLADGTELAAAGEPMILADILDMVLVEAPPVLGFTLLLVVATLWLLLGQLRLAALCLLPAVATLAATLGLLPAAELQLNYINIILIPVLFGVGVDGGVHLITRLGDGVSLNRVLDHTGRTVAGATLTTALGFGALLVAQHAGLKSLAKLAVLGLSANLLACLVALPALVVVVRRLRSRDANSDGGGAS